MRIQPGGITAVGAISIEPLARHADDCLLSFAASTARNARNC